MNTKDLIEIPARICRAGISYESFLNKLQFRNPL